MRRLTASVIVLMAGAAVFGFDQLTKGFLPTLHTTSRIPLEFMAVAIVVVVVIGSVQEVFIQKLFAGVLIGAAAGNLLDILVLGRVRDIFLINSVAFNVADIGIIVSLVLFLLFLFKSKRWRADRL